MRLSVKREGTQIVSRIYLGNQMVYRQSGYNSRQEATLDAWVNALLVQKVVNATIESVRNAEVL